MSWGGIPAVRSMATALATWAVVERLTMLARLWCLLSMDSYHECTFEPRPIVLWCRYRVAVMAWILACTYGCLHDVKDWSLDGLLSKNYRVHVYGII